MPQSRIYIAEPLIPPLLQRLGTNDFVEAIRQFRDQGIDAVKILNHPRDAALAIVAAARAVGMPVFGHTLSPGGMTRDGRVVNFTIRLTVS